MKRIVLLLRLLPVLPGVQWSDRAFMMDLQRWRKIYGLNRSNVLDLAELLWRHPEFRNLFIFRNSHRALYRRWIALWYRPLATLYIDTPKIGGGLFIQHGFATMIAARSIGDNCWINQQVTIGYRDNTLPPEIGDNVSIYCGAKVLGNIRIGDGAVIGANAVVVKDVERDAVMVGIPAKRIR